MTKMKRIVVQNNLVEYFKDLVTSALKNQKVDTDEMAEFYLVHLLAEFHKHEKNRPQCPQTGEEEPWAITYLRAAHLQNQEQVNVLKNLGDRSLYLSGVFSRHLESKSVGIDYYISMGGHAYNHVANLMATTHSELTLLFKELSEKFIAFVDILTEVSESSGLKNDKDLLELYEKWLKTGSQRAARCLVQAGIPLTPTDSDTIQ